MHAPKVGLHCFLSGRKYCCLLLSRLRRLLLIDAFTFSHLLLNMGSSEDVSSRHISTTWPSDLKILIREFNYPGDNTIDQCLLKKKNYINLLVALKCHLLVSMPRPHLYHRLWYFLIFVVFMLRLHKHIFDYMMKQCETDSAKVNEELHDPECFFCQSLFGWCSRTPWFPVLSCTSCCSPAKVI